MAPLPSLARLSLRPAPVGNGDEPSYRRLSQNPDGSMNWGLRGPPEGYDEDNGGGAGPSAAGPSSDPPATPPYAPTSPSYAPASPEYSKSDDDGEVTVEKEVRGDEWYLDKKKTDEAIVIEDSDDERSPGSPLTPEPKAPRRTESGGRGKGKQPAKPVNPAPRENTPLEVNYERLQLDQVYSRKQQEAISQTTRATTAFLNGDVDNGLALLAQARDSGARMREVKDRLDELGGPPPGAMGRYGSSYVPTGIRTLTPSRAAAAGPPPPP